MKALKDPRISIGLTITLLVVLLAIVGPWVAAYGEYEIVGKPYSLEGVPSEPTTWGRTCFPGCSTVAGPSSSSLSWPPCSEWSSAW